MSRPTRTLFVIAVACGLLATDVSAQRRSSFKLGESNFLRSFQPVVSDVHRSHVRFERFDKHDEVWVDASLGVVVDPSGLVITKASELQGTLRASLALFRNLDATVLLRNERHDVALVQIGKPTQFESRPLEPITWSAKTSEVGRWVITPGIDRVPAAVGVVSVPPRTIAPSDERPVLGIVMQDEPGPPLIKSVKRDSAADRAGLIAGDAIRKINDSNVATRFELTRVISRHHPGDSIELGILRDGESMTVRATLQHVPPASSEELDPWSPYRSRWATMNELGSELSVRRANFPWAVQHDTVLRPEDCGGAAVNLQGEAIGLNIARSGRTESLMIPASHVRTIIDGFMTETRARWTTSANGD